MQTAKAPLFGICICACIALFALAQPTNAILVGYNPDIHMDIPGVVANDFHIEGRIQSGDPDGNWSDPPKLIVHIDDRFPEFSYSIEPDRSDPDQNWFIFKADWSGADYHYCDVLHLGLLFDVRCHNVAVDLVGWWTKDGQPIPVPPPPQGPPNGGAVPVPGFSVADNPIEGPQRYTIYNDSHLWPGLNAGEYKPGIQLEIVQLELVSLNRAQLEDLLGPLPEAFQELRLGGSQENLPWIPVENENGPISPQNPLSFPADSFFDVFFDLSVPGGLHPVEPVTLMPSDFLLTRVQVQFINNAGEPDFRWVWHLHEAHSADLGDAPDSTNSWGAATTAYPAGGPAGIVAHYPTVYLAGSPPFGPIHHLPFGLAFLGQNVTLEMEADIGPDMDGVNNLDPPADVPDLDQADDGVNVPLLLPHCKQATFDYLVTILPAPMPPQPDLYVNVWFDWNRDGDWDDTLRCTGPDVAIPVPEWAVQNQKLSGLPPGLHTITTPPFLCWHPLVGAELEPIWMRITLSEQPWDPVAGELGNGGSGPASGYMFGETEDYYFTPVVTRECLPTADGKACQQVPCDDPSQVCVPVKIRVDHNADPPTYIILACKCLTDNECHVEIEPERLNPFCVGGCPEGQECELIATENEDGTIDFECKCREVPPPEFEYGDAPEGGLAYPSTGVIGAFPTCITLQPPGFIRHGLAWGHFGPGFDFELDGNAGLCPNCFPPYDKDECWQDGDAGLLIPEPYTIQAGAVVPCPQATGSALGITCTTAQWGRNIDIHVVNQMPVDAYVNVLIDWNQDGKWSGVSPCTTAAAPEHVLVNFVVPQGYVGPLSGLNPPAFLIGPNAGFVWSRFSITEKPVPTPPEGWDGSGIFEDGETEDYLLRVDKFVPPPKLDFGDAPERPYPTTLAADGARHTIVAGYCLGASIDDEPDGQPTALADGDDTDAQGDDEDGITFITTPLIPGQMAIIDVTNSMSPGQSGYLDGWIDFGGDGSWADPGDRIFNAQPLSPLGFNTFFVPVPFTATPNIRTYARFRFSSTGGLPYTGAAKDGEVEDYIVEIGENPDIKWFQPPDHSPNGIDIRLDRSDDRVRIIADDFKCTSYGLITDVHLWCSWKNDEKGEITRIHLSIYSDDPIGPGGSDQKNTYSKPDQLLWTYEVVPGQFNEALIRDLLDTPPHKGEFWWDPVTGELIPEGDSSIWRIDIDIPMEHAFLQEGAPNKPTIYWLAVEADTVNGQLGWKTRRWPEHYNDDAVFSVGTELPKSWRELRYPPGHPYHQMENNSIDMAFVLTGVSIEPPAQHLKWSQPPVEWDLRSKRPVFCGWDELSFSDKQLAGEPAYWKIVADDFHCLGAMPITSVHWWGSYKEWQSSKPPAHRPQSWQICFWSNAPAGPNIPFSRPNKLLWQIDIPASRVEESWVGTDEYPERPPESCFHYYVKLKPDEFFWQEQHQLETSADQIFWISITAVYRGFPGPQSIWGWKTRPWPWMDNAVTFELRQDSLKPGQLVNPKTISPVEDALVCGTKFDMAFRLDTDPNYIKWEQPFTGLRHWRHYEDEMATGTETTKVVKWLQPPDLSPTGVDVDMYWVPLADDFKCTKTGPITDITIWGSFADDKLPAKGPGSLTFQLTIYSDKPQSGDRWSEPAKIVWGPRIFQPGQYTVTQVHQGPEDWFDPATNVYMPANHQLAFQYDFHIEDDPFIQQEGKIYWLEVQDLPRDDSRDYTFGWKTTTIEQHWNDDAVWNYWLPDPPRPPVVRGWNPLRYPPEHPYQGTTLDLAFELSTKGQELIIDRLVADDWQCMGHTPITAIVWWGSYIGYHHQACQCEPQPKPPKPDYFLLSIWTDVPAGEDLPFSHPGRKIWEYRAYDYDEVLVGYDKHPEDVNPNQQPGVSIREPVFRYSVRLPRDKWFRQREVEGIYWLSTVAVYRNPQTVRYPWGWTNHKHVFNDNAVAGMIDPTAPEPAPRWEEIFDQTGESADMSFVLFTEPGCFPSWYSTYEDWLSLGKPNCWCGIYGNPTWPYQCDGDANNKTETFFKYRIYIKDLNIIVANWKKKIDDPTLNPCADIDHKPETFFKYRVYINDLNTIVGNWKKKDADLPGNCPRPE